MVRLRRRRGVLAAAGGGAALVAVGVALLVVFTHRGASSPPPVLRAIAAPPLASATQTPSPLAVAPPADTPAPADLSDRQAPAYSAVFDLDIPAVGLHEPIA